MPWTASGCISAAERTGRSDGWDGGRGDGALCDSRAGLKPLAQAEKGAEQTVAILMETPIPDGVTWIVHTEIPAWGLALDITTGGKDETEATAEAETWLRDSAVALKELTRQARLRGMAN